MLKNLFNDRNDEIDLLTIASKDDMSNCILFDPPIPRNNFECLIIRLFKSISNDRREEL